MESLGDTRCPRKFRLELRRYSGVTLIDLHLDSHGSTNATHHQFEYAFWPPHICAMGFIKLSILFFFRRVFKGEAVTCGFGLSLQLEPPQVHWELTRFSIIQGVPTGHHSTTRTGHSLPSLRSGPWHSSLRIFWRVEPIHHQPGEALIPCAMSASRLSL